MGKTASEPSHSLLPQAGAIPYRLTAGGAVEVLLITNRQGEWIVPKGMLEPNLSEAEVAAVEALEEAGVVGQIVGTKVGSYEYDKWGQRCRVTLFAMRVDRLMDRWLEQGSRRRAWMGVDEATRRAAYAGLGEAIQKLSEKRTLARAS